MIRYTTPTIRIRVINVSPSTFDMVKMTLSQVGAESLTKDADVEGDVVSIHLTQTESARFRREFPASVQVNAWKGEERYAGNMMNVPVFENLLSEVIPDDA